jgi:tRNA G46 methylase TrmB
MVAKHGQWHALYTELKTHIQDVLNDTGAWDDFDTEKLAKHGIAKPPTLYSCEYKVKYTGTVTVKADSEEAARNKADEIMSKAIYCQLSEIDDEQVSDQNHNEFELEINDCEEQ